MNKGLKVKILALKEQGKSHREIQKELNCSKATISYHCSDTVKDYYKKARQGNRKQQMTALKTAHGACCSMCGYNKCQAALHFHHIGDKVATVSQLAMSNGKKAMTTEAAKCELICANCHAELHWPD